METTLAEYTARSLKRLGMSEATVEQTSRDIERFEEIRRGGTSNPSNTDRSTGELIKAADSIREAISLIQGAKKPVARRDDAAHVKELRQTETKVKEQLKKSLVRLGVKEDVALNGL
jgi:hypothetical protein